jgi:hypothetical protein
VKAPTNNTPPVFLFVTMTLNISDLFNGFQKVHWVLSRSCINW